MPDSLRQTTTRHGCAIPTRVPAIGACAAPDRDVVPLITIADIGPRPEQHDSARSVICVLRNGCARAAPADYGSRHSETAFERARRIGVLQRRFAALAGEPGDTRAAAARDHAQEDAPAWGRSAQNGAAPRPNGG